MTKRFAILILGFVTLLGGELTAFRAEVDHTTSHSEKPATIKVLLKKDLEGALLEIKGGFKVIDPATGKRYSAGTRGKRFFVFPLDNGIKWGEEYPGVFQVQVLPTSGDTTFLLDGIQYRGAVTMFLLDGKLSFVNELDVETYLKVTMANALPRTLHSAVRDSAAIIARTNAYYTALANHDAYWHVNADDVKYEGYTKAYSDAEMDRSIDSTKYLVMTYDSQPFPATWTENSAGHTASYNTIYRKNIQSPNGVEAIFAKKDRSDWKWKYSIPTSELATKLKINRVSEIDTFVDMKTKKVYGIRIKDGKHVKDISIAALQKLLGEDKVKSSDFSLEMKGGKVSFAGHGKGLGVGLCLYSAQHMADGGELAPKLLAEFFPFTHLEKMRAYPDMIITHSREYFIAPKKKRTIGFDDGDISHAPNTL